jgi:predicted DNA-binding ribbon-helix-helix protein
VLRYRHKNWVAIFLKVLLCRPHRIESPQDNFTKTFGEAGMKSLVVKRSVMINRHKTSVSLEDPFWSGLKEIAHSERATMSELLAKIDGTRERGNLSSAIRLFVLDQVRTNGMLRLTATTLMLAVALTASFPTTASAWYYPPKPPPIIPHSTSGAAGAGAGATAGFIGFVAVLAAYDLLRRTTCVGDFLYLGGPGFTEKMPNGNVMIPQCLILTEQRRKRG